MVRNVDRDGLRNRIETFFLTRFSLFWKLVQAIPWVRQWFNQKLLRSAILKTKVRPHALSLKSDYPTWESLTDRTYSGRHLPPATDEFQAGLPDPIQVTKLFQRTPESTRTSQKSTVLFTNFAQWFTDGFLRTSHDGTEDSYKRNTSNHEIDLCQIYGLNPARTTILRSHSGGLLRSQTINGQEFPPFYIQDGVELLPYSEVVPPKLPQLPLERRSKLFAGGVERVNVQVGYAAMNTLFLREHNRICRELQKAYPQWCKEPDGGDERIFQTARNVLIVILLRIVIEDYINHITPYHFKFFLDAAPFKRESWYRTNWMTVEFNLLYRWHSMVPDTVLVGNTHVPVATTLFNNQLLIDRGLGPMFESAAKQCASELGLSNTTTNLMDAEYGALILSRKARLRSYNDYRELFGFPRVTDWAQITGDVERQKALQQLYGHVDKLEFFTGLFAEDVRPNSALSPLIGRMVGVDAFSQALTNPLLSVNVFNPTTFSDVGWKIIHETNSISQLLHRNLGSDTNKYAIKFTQDGDEIPAPTGSVPSELWQGPGNWAQRVAQLQAPSMKARSLETPETTTEDRDMFVK